MKLNRLIVLWGVVLALNVPEVVLEAQDTNSLEMIRKLQKRVDELERKLQELEVERQPATRAPANDEKIEDLDQKLKNLERERLSEKQVAEAKAKVTPKLALDDQGFSFASANGNFALQLKGVLQVDSRSFFEDHGIAGNDGFLLRRARPIIQGTVFRDFDFLFLPDFGTSANGGSSSTPQIYDAYLNYRYSRALQFQVGKFKSPVGLEQLQADRDILFNERALPTDLVPNRDIGFQLHGELFDGIASYAGGVFNGVGDARNSGNSDFDDDKSFAGRIFVEPFRTLDFAPLAGFGFGLGGSFEDIQGTNSAALPNTAGGSAPGFATVGQQQFFAYGPTNGTVVPDGQHWRLSPQGYYYHGPFGLLGEYVISDQRVRRLGSGPQAAADLQNTGWQVAGSWLLTGEDASYGQVVPRHPFGVKGGGWGAWQIAVRYSVLDVDPNSFPLYANPSVSARSAQEWAVGLNWYLNRNVRVGLSFSQTRFDGGGGSGSGIPAAVTRQRENVLFTRVQLSF